jgi:glycosyltransferase involved in cell wall biosynthesis
MTVYIVDLESIPTRYTCEWKSHLPKLLEEHGHEIYVIDGPHDLPSNTTPGMFLNFAATNIYKAAQVEKFSRLFSENRIKDGDYFLFTDAWHPGVINLRYMADLLGIKIKIGGLWHAGSYDKWDGLGRLIGDAKWVRHAEKSFFWAIDHNYFATDFHIDMFLDNLFEEDIVYFDNKIVRTGWPMEYMPETIALYKTKKRDLILFPHRIAPEKQVEIFKDLAEALPQYEWIVCQEQNLTKEAYHTLLGEAKMVFSANLQETLGISMYEGSLTNAIPLVPDRLSYKEMYAEIWKYPSSWTESFSSYLHHKNELCAKIVEYMTDYDEYAKLIPQQARSLHHDFFSATALLENIK